MTELETLRAIARDLASKKAPVYDGMYCMLCNLVDEDETKTNHAESCPWLRAVQYTAQPSTMTECRCVYLEGVIAQERAARKRMDDRRKEAALCTRGDTLACKAPGSNMPRGNWCCVCHGGDPCNHDECRRPFSVADDSSSTHQTAELPLRLIREYIDDVARMAHGIRNHDKPFHLCPMAICADAVELMRALDAAREGK